MLLLCFRGAVLCIPLIPMIPILQLCPVGGGVGVGGSVFTLSQSLEPPVSLAAGVGLSFTLPYEI